MAVINHIQGVGRVLANLRMQHKTMSLRVASALKRAGLLVQRESQKLVPVNFGNLKASAFTRAEGSGWRTVVNVGYTAFYAIYVHELVEMRLKGKPRPKGRGKFWDPQGRAQAKFLEAPARRLAPTIRKMILDAGRIR